MDAPQNSYKQDTENAILQKPMRYRYGLPRSVVCPREFGQMISETNLALFDCFVEGIATGLASCIRYTHSNITDCGDSSVIQPPMRVSYCNSMGHSWNYCASQIKPHGHGSARQPSKAIAMSGRSRHEVIAMDKPSTKQALRLGQ
ncbi:hypothetical protein IAQ61_002291 [Plenodomus lingam]|uniref:uncharacterized protein n=1 Tax=Leptosphaeria maculans TaxID=5022 RepID=UPI00331C0AB2|nr:hypothetical protein IAQ61_002291 [Plenodomus lingam]